MNKFDRVVSTLILLQSRRNITAQEIAARFDVSLRTVYRDIRTLELAGVPISGEAGIGYSLVEGYQLPPVMFTTIEAMAMIAAEKFLAKSNNQETSKSFQSALTKIKSVLKSDEKASAERLNEAIVIKRQYEQFSEPHLQTIFNAIGQNRVVRIHYQKLDGSPADWREIEPVGTYFNYNNWYCMAWCRLRNDYRTFKVKRMLEAVPQDETFLNNHPSIQEYLEKESAQNETKIVEVLFSKEMVEYVENDRFMFGLAKKEPVGDFVKLTFLVPNYYMIARWILMYTNHIKIEGQPELKEVLRKLVSQLSDQYL